MRGEGGIKRAEGMATQPDCNPEKHAHTPNTPEEPKRKPSAMSSTSPLGNPTLRGYVYANDGLTLSTKAMHTQMQLINTHTDNIANFGIPGYQRKRSVVTSFAEHFGPNAVDTVTDTTIGRLRLSNYPLDLALNTPGYFQRLGAGGTVELTRDGRFHLDKDGWILSLDGKRILGADGAPLRFSTLPSDPEREVKVSPQGEVHLYNPHTGKSV